ncbi:ankyrin repeat domain-containing protein 26 [Marmota flaviventris]|uniref:ankyrin repeat domain-containing protein 26 n=1 Tax=Marmota flaviventris TaxID=93162 RepID=UPI003A874058
MLLQKNLKFFWSKNAMEDLDESEPTLIASMAFQVTCPNYKDIWAYIEKPSTSYEDPHSLPKIQNAFDSCQRIIELDKSHCSQCLLHMKEVAKLENKLCGMKEKLSEMENVKSKLEQREIRWKQELCHLRHDLKEKEKKLRDFDQLLEKMNNQLREKDEKHNKQIELNKEFQLSSGKLKAELKTARSNSNLVDVRQLPQELTDNLTEQPMSEDSLEYSSSNYLEVEDEVQGLKKKLDQITGEANNLNTNLEATFSKYSHLDGQFELAFKSLQNTCEEIQNNQKKLEEDFANLKVYVQDYKIKNGQGELHRCEIRQRTREILEENPKRASLFSETFNRASKILEELNENNEFSLMKLMQFRIGKVESQVFETPNEICDEVQR